jgi:flagellar M-ring protein FliF
MSDLVPISTGTPLERLRSLGGQPAVRRALPWFLGAAAIGAVGLTYSLLMPAPQRMLYSQLSDSERAGVVTALEKAAIDYIIDNQTGALTVGEDDLYRARMLVASDGALATPESGADALNSLPLGASRTLEGERLRSAREHELQQTIMEIDGVDSVRVHLAEAAKSVFVREDTPATASVMVRMARGRQLADSQVSAVVNLVAGSVPGLSPDAVRVIDQHGRLVSQANSADSDRLELQSRLEEKLRNQLDQLLTPMLGQGNFSSEIQVELDMDAVTSARESYDKQGVVRSETQQQSQTSGAASAIGIPGALSNTPAPAATASPGPPQGTPAPAASAAPTTGETSATRTYELGREVAVANTTPGKLKRLSVAVALSQAAMKKGKAADVEAIKQLVSAAVGADPARGDQVAVMMRPFEPVTDEAVPFYEAGWFATVVRSAVALLAVLLVLLLGVRPLIGALRRRSEPPETGDESAQTSPPTADMPTDTTLLGRQVSLAQRVVAEKPDDAVQALREMLAREEAAA